MVCLLLLETTLRSKHKSVEKQLKNPSGKKISWCKLRPYFNVKMVSTTEQRRLEYFFEGKISTANMDVVRAENGITYYWFKFKNRSPEYFKKVDGRWVMSGAFLPPGLKESLIAALEVQEEMA